jgi:thioredoxin reductase
MADDAYDVAIIGGGPAGLSAALLLGRSRRRVVVCDHGRPRNYAAKAVHGFLGLDGVDPTVLRNRAATTSSQNWPGLETSTALPFITALIAMAGSIAINASWLTAKGLLPQNFP